MNETLEMFPDPTPATALGDSRVDSPLGHRLRPKSWEDFHGLEEIDSALATFLKRGQGMPPSLILWGPPGSGKTSLARLIGTTFECHFVPFSAVLGGVKEVREIVEKARHSTRRTILFVDEIHRFNRGQQDAFLPHVENGTIILIGATTENPSFYLTGALLSRCKTLVLPPLSTTALGRIISNAEKETGIKFELEAREVAINYSGGDARRLLNLIEGLASTGISPTVSIEKLRSFLGSKHEVFYDRSGEEHYNMVSAFIKSMRGSDPDAALYWGFRMLEGGEDARFLLRRMMIFASEDIGNADPRALTLAVSTFDAFEKLGLPEGRIPLAHCITYLATAPKSNRSYVAMGKAVAAVKEHATVAVPLHLRNAPTKLMKDLQYGEGYQYPHDTESGYVAAEYLPHELRDRKLYEPKDSGYEKTIKERMELLRSQLKGRS